MKRAISVLVVSLIIALAVPPTAGAAPSEWAILGYHVVQPGETLFCIGRAYGVDPWAIAAQNSIVCASCIYPGMVLAIPAAYTVLPPGPVCTPQFGDYYYYPSCTCAAYHTVALGDTLTHISLVHGVSMWRIAECNGIYNLNYIRAGDVLCIPNP